MLEMSTMQLTLQGLDGPRSKTLRRCAEERIKRALDPFRARIARAVVWVDDINGPRGGVDKRCRAQAQLASGTSLLVAAVDQTAERAIDRAVRRLRSIVANTLKRRWTERRRSCRTQRHRVPHIDE